MAQASLRECTLELVTDLTDSAIVLQQTVSEATDTFVEDLETAAVDLGTETVDEAVSSVCDQVVNLEDNEELRAALEATYWQALDPEGILEMELEDDSSNLAVWQDALNEVYDPDAAVKAAWQKALHITGGSMPRSQKKSATRQQYDQANQSYHKSVNQSLQNLRQGLNQLLERFVQNILRARQQLATDLGKADQAVPDPTAAALKAAAACGAADRVKAQAQ